MNDVALVPRSDISKATELPAVHHGLVAIGAEWEAIKEQAKMLIKTGFFPKAVNTPEKAVAVMLAGRELGIPPMQSLRSVHIIDAKPTLSAETMLALAYQRVPGLICNVSMIEAGENATGCRVSGNRPGGKPTEITFTEHDAKAAGLLSRPTWTAYRPAMYRARAISAWCRVVTPDAILGCYTAEEVESMRPLAPVPDAIDATFAPIAREEEPEIPESVKPTLPPEEPQERCITEKQKSRLWAITYAAAAKRGEDKKAATLRLREVLSEHGIESSADVPEGRYDYIVKRIEDWGYGR